MCTGCNTALVTHYWSQICFSISLTNYVTGYYIRNTRQCPNWYSSYCWNREFLLNEKDNGWWLYSQDFFFELRWYLCCSFRRITGQSHSFPKCCKTTKPTPVSPNQEVGSIYVYISATGLEGLWLLSSSPVPFFALSLQSLIATFFFHLLITFLFRAFSSIFTPYSLV